MTQEEKIQFDDMKRRLDDIEKVVGADFIKNIHSRIIKNIPTNENSGLYSGTENATDEKLADITIGMGGGTFTVLGAPVYYMQITHNGKIYKIPCY